MRYRNIMAAAAVTIALLCPAPASAEPAETVSIVTDQENRAIRFIIDGREVARLDETGWHIRGSISYGGTLTDYGASGFEKHIAASDREAADEE